MAVSERDLVCFCKKNKTRDILEQQTRKKTGRTKTQSLKLRIASAKEESTERPQKVQRRTLQLRQERRNLSPQQQ